MAQWSLKANGNIVPRRSVRPVNASELTSKTEIRNREVFTKLIMTRWDTEVLTTMIDCDIDHRKTEAAVRHDGMYTVSHNGTKSIQQTTIGWQLLVQWKDCSKRWVPLSVLKASNPVDVAEYAKARSINTEPAFAWWAPYTLQK
jgi:hypothetical protein